MAVMVPMAAIGMSLVTGRTARHGETGIERNRPTIPAIDGGNRAHHDRRVEHMVIKREIVGGDGIDPLPFCSVQFSARSRFATSRSAPASDLPAQ